MKTRGVEIKSESNEVRCWAENPQTQVLRIELRDGSFFLFPYGWLVRVQFLPADKVDKVILLFNSHSVFIFGKKLRELGEAFQQMTVEWIKENACDPAMIASVNRGYIENILVTETAPASDVDLDLLAAKKEDRK